MASAIAPTPSVPTYFGVSICVVPGLARVFTLCVPTFPDVPRIFVLTLVCTYISLVKAFPSFSGIC